MTIGFDIDNTMTCSREKANEYFANYEFNRGFASYTKLEEPERRKFLDIYCLDIMRNCDLKEGVKETFDYLKSKGHRVVIISRRGFEEPAEVDEITIEYLKKHNIEYDAIHFRDTEKGKTAKEEGVLLYVDDHLFNLDSIKEYGVKPLLYGIKERNTEYDFVTSWSELLEYIKKEGF